MIHIENVTFSYGQSDKTSNGIKNVTLHIKQGECVVLCGESGCGKTTVTRLINGLIPHYYEGELSGTVKVDGADITQQQLYDTAKVVGSVFQNPRSQFFNVDTTSEITFGCENLGMPKERICERLEKTVRDFQLEKLMDRSIFELSGGEKQRIACAGAAMIDPKIYVLDEPSSNLDAASIMNLRSIIAAWKKQGKTIVISEHRLYFLKDIADRYIYLKDGEICGEYDAAEIAARKEEERKKMGLRAFSLENIMPVAYPVPGGGKIELKNFHFSYRDGKEALQIRDGEIPANRIVGIIGNNGAGKSTFSRCLCGLEKHCGEIVWNGQKYRPKDRINTCYMVMQEVNHQLFTESVMEEVLISMEDQEEGLAEQILDRLDLTEYKDRHPMSLSGGQKQRVAIASAVASGRKIMIFDEPTSGLDYKHMKEVAEMLRQLGDAGISLYLITHDVELIAECCTDIIYLEKGLIREQYILDERGMEKIRQFFGVK